MGIYGGGGWGLRRQKRQSFLAKFEIKELMAHSEASEWDVAGAEVPILF
jgi:hypothetical protein